MLGAPELYQSAWIWYFHEKVNGGSILAKPAMGGMSTMNTNEFPGIKEWEKDFLFLRKFGLEAIIKMMLLLASSPKELRHLHDTFLPENARLLRDDLVRLDEFWKKYFHDGTISVIKAHNDPTAQWLATTPFPEDGLTGYYFYRLQNAGIKFYPKAIGRYLPESPFLQNIIACETGNTEYKRLLDARSPDVKDMQRAGAEYCTSLFMFDRFLELGCSLSDDGTSLLVRFCIAQKRLTESITHKLLTLPPYDWTDSEEKVNCGKIGMICYRVSSKCLLPCLTLEGIPLINAHQAATLLKGAKVQGSNDYQKVLVVTDNSFMRTVVSRLNDLGLPITGDLPPSMIQK